MSRPWLLPGVSGFYFVFLSQDKVDKASYRQIPSSRAVEMLSAWLVSQRTDLQAMVEALSNSCIQTENKDQIRRRLAQAFLSNDLLLFEHRMQTSTVDYDVYSCIVNRVDANLEQRELQVRVAMSIGKHTREEAIELIRKGVIPSLMDVQVSASGVAHVALFGYEYALLTGKDLSPGESNERQSEGHDNTQSLSKWAKVSKAFLLSAGSWPGQTYEAAKQAFSDPLFVASLVAVTGFYVFLWLSPDPTFLTKGVAAGLTLYLWAQFAWDDIWGTIEALYALTERCNEARTERELQAAGDGFAKKVGQVGFDILLMSVMWKVGKAARPRLAEMGIKRAMATAEARVEAIQYQPGTNNVRAAQGKALRLLTDARTRAGSAEPSRILDALAESLSNEARRGLTQYRKALHGDARALTALESELGKGADLDSFLSHRGVSAAQAAEAKGSHLKERQQLARLELIKMKAMRDQTLRQAVSNEIARQELERFMGSELVEGVDKEMARLQVEQLQDPARSRPVREKLMRKKLQSLLDPRQRKTLREKVTGMVVDMLRRHELPPEFWERLKQGIQLGDPEALVGELGEAIQRSALSEKYPESAGFRIFANVEVVRLVEGFSKIADWQAVDKASGGSGDARGFYEADNKVWKSITEVDALVGVKDAAGKWRPVEMEQVKTGVKDQASRAAAQNDKARVGLEEVTSGSQAVRVYERISKNILGEDITRQFDLTRLTEVKLTTRGLPGKEGFGSDVLFPREILTEVAKGLIEKKGLPPIAAPRPVPVSNTLPRRERAP